MARSRPERTSARTCSRSTAAGSQASAPAPEAIGTAAMAVSSAPQASASVTAHLRALRAEEDPSTPTTMRRTGVYSAPSVR